MTLIVLEVPRSMVLHAGKRVSVMDWSAREVGATVRRANMIDAELETDEPIDPNGGWDIVPPEPCVPLASVTAVAPAAEQFSLFGA